MVGLGEDRYDMEKLGDELARLKLDLKCFLVHMVPQLNLVPKEVMWPLGSQVESLRGAHLDKECPLNKEVKSVDEVKYDLGASVNVIPKSMFEHLKLARLKKIDMLVEMADMTKRAPIGIVENVLVKIDRKSIKEGGLSFPEFLLVRYKEAQSNDSIWDNRLKKESSDEECLTSESKDEEYVMAVRNFKKFFKRRGSSLDVETQIILLGNVQNHQRTGTKENSSEVLGVVAVKKIMKRLESKRVS
uniref:Transposase, Ptta/En/Spm, transposase, Tnp1/En/Spm-like protein n=1 Tax=Tanacetum cinerariifolium TaxID=118510 RepID=A0A6L2JEQ6_TANCI|nr:hypothetical protein [Tanacetum cinerariifolium]